MSKKAHNWKPFVRSWAPWGYCIHCGLIPLKNEASRKAWAKPCPGSEEDK